jgi:hypothetical protein
MASAAVESLRPASTRTEVQQAVCRHNALARARSAAPPAIDQPVVRKLGGLNVDRHAQRGVVAGTLHFSRALTRGIEHDAHHLVRHGRVEKSLLKLVRQQQSVFEGGHLNKNSTPLSTRVCTCTMG